MEHRIQLEKSLAELQSILQEMGNRVREAVQNSVLSLKDTNIALAKAIVNKDHELNLLDDQVLELGAKIIATQQPVAKDLRKIIIAFRISSDLERMGDLAVDIAKVTIRLDDQQRIKPLVDIKRMEEITSNMITEAMQCYKEENLDLAYHMAKSDDEVDHLYSQILRELFIFMIEKPETINQGMLLCFVGRYLERIADHATNIGENVVYLVKNKRPDLNS